MARMFRMMKKDADDKPTVGQTAMTLGVRPGEVDTNAQGNAIVNHRGMSVNPAWRVAPLFLIPRRLGTGGRGRDNTFCFRRGSGAFQRSPCGPGLELLPDSTTHGVVRPAQIVLLTQYEADLHATRLEWEIDET
jgi:hypothetical protein